MIRKKFIGKQKCSIQGDALIIDGESINLLGLLNVTDGYKKLWILPLILGGGLLWVGYWDYVANSTGELNTWHRDFLWNVTVMSVLNVMFVFLFVASFKFVKDSGNYRSYWLCYLDRRLSFFSLASRVSRIENISPDMECVTLWVEKDDNINTEMEMKELERRLAQKRVIN